MSFRSPFAMIMGMPAAVTFLAALILLSMPPVPSAPGISLASFSTFFPIVEISGISSASGLVRGSAVNKPSISVRLISRSASIISAISAERLSLSPNWISSTTTVSFSLIIGTIFHDNSVYNVLQALRYRVRLLRSELVSKIWATFFSCLAKAFS